MNLREFLEIFFVVAAGMAMPFIVIGSYFTLVSSKNRSKPLAIFFLIISLIYALTYTYFSWKKSVKESESWKKIVEKKKEDDNDKKNN